MHIIKALLCLILPISMLAQSVENTEQLNTSPSKFQFIFNANEQQGHSSVFYTPIAGYNSIDGILIGAHFTNSLNLDRKIKWSFTPIFGLRTKELVGYGQFSYNIQPNKLFDKVEIGLKAKRFNYFHHNLYEYNDSYLRVAPFVNFELSSSTERTHNVLLRWSYSMLNYGQGINIHELEYKREQLNLSVGEVSYTSLKENSSGDNSLNANIQFGSQFAKLAIIYKNAFAYEKERFVYMRAQGGYLLRGDNGSFVNSRLTGTGRMSSGYFQNDYMFDETLGGRNERDINHSVFAQQIFEKDAHIKTLANNVISESYMLSLGLKADIPIPKVPIQAYIDGVVYPELSTGKATAVFSTGIAISLYKERFEIYFPLYSSKTLSENINVANLKFIQKIMFKIDLKAFEYGKAIKDIETLF